MAADPNYKTNADRVKNRTVLIELVRIVFEGFHKKVVKYSDLKLSLYKLVGLVSW
jgi:hypothetical protein